MSLSPSDSWTRLAFCQRGRHEIQLSTCNGTLCNLTQGAFFAGFFDANRLFACDGLLSERCVVQYVSGKPVMRTPYR